ncbi:hypothetical protein ABPG72_012108 [Tetrahymena utriculariae]
MEVEQSYDTPEYIIGQISALKLLGYSNRQAAEQITEWGYSISHAGVGNQWQKYQSGDISSNRQNSRRKSRINSEVNNKMIDEVLNNRYMTAAEMSRNQDLTRDSCSVSAIKRMLSDEGLKSYRPQKIPYITNINKGKQFQFAKQVQKWKDKWDKSVFSDECYVRAESNHHRYVRRFSGEELSEEYCIKKYTFKKGFFVLIWGAISVNGSEQLFFADKIPFLKYKNYELAIALSKRSKGLKLKKKTVSIDDDEEYQDPRKQQKLQFKTKILVKIKK